MADNIENEIELARRQLKEDLEKREKEAQDSIDKILSSNAAEFCSRCSRKVDDRLDWSGRCLHKDCQGLICDSCWSAENKRYCSTHYEEAVGAEKEGKKKTFFKPEADEIISDQPKEEFTDGEREKVSSLLENYIDFVKKRWSSWGPDWTNEGWIENAKPQLTGKGDAFEITVSSKKFLSKKEKMKIIVRPVYGKKSEDLDFVLSTIKQNGPEIYHLLVLIGNECSADALSFVDNFSRQNASLFLIEPSKQLIFMDEKPITRIYSCWVDQSKIPKQLKDVLIGFSKEKVSGRDVLTAKQTSEGMGISEQDAFLFLSTCKFLKHVEETDTFYFVSKD